MKSNENDKIYFIVKDNESNGPFNLEELKNENIKPIDLVWFEGISDWKNANEIDSLKVLFEKKSPPPIPNSGSSNSIEDDSIDNKTNSNKSNQNQENKNYSTEFNHEKIDQEQTKTSSSKIALIMVSVFALLLIIIGFWSNNKSQNKKIEAALREQERINLEHQAKFEAQEQEKKNLKIEELKGQIETYKTDLENSYIELEAAKYKLNDIQGFHFLRTESEKSYQIKSQIQLIKDWETHIRKLQFEISNLQAEVQSLSY
jgi:hypothetical protein